MTTLRPEDEGLVLFSGKGMILFANHAARALFPHDSAEGSYLTLCRDANYIQVVEQALDAMARTANLSGTAAFMNLRQARWRRTAHGMLLCC